jgi:RNA polymerase sigma-70 factor (ECF subfamily)
MPVNPRDELAAVLSLLPTAHREVLLMRFVDGMELGEIGLALNIPVGTVKSRLHNGLQTLREDSRTRRYFDLQ